MFNIALSIITIASLSLSGWLIPQLQKVKDTLENVRQGVEYSVEQSSKLNSEFQEQTLELGSKNAVGGETYYLSGSGISSSATSIGLTKFGYTQPNGTYAKFTITNFGDLGCATIQPGATNGKQEFVSFTGVTQNSDGTATLTGAIRGLERYSPFTASTTLQTSHAGASTVVISNSPPCFYEQYANVNNVSTISALWNFSSIPYSWDTATSTRQFATRAYVNSVAVQGVATSTTDTSGIGLLATGVQAAAGTYTLTSPYFLSTLISTSTYFGNGSNKVVVTGLTNKIDPNFIATSSIDAPAGYNWTASTTFSGATTTINTASVISASASKPLILNGVSTVFPATQGASSTALMNDGSGNLHWYQPQWELLGENTLQTANATTTVSFTGTHRSLMIDVDIAGVSAASSVFLVFNDDVASNYSMQLTEINNTVSTSIRFTATSTRLKYTTEDFDFGYYKIFMNNNASRVKVGDFSGVASVGTAPQNRNFGSFVWNNTSDSITSVSLITGYTMTFSAGTRLSVYGSRD